MSVIHCFQLSADIVVESKGLGTFVFDHVFPRSTSPKGEIELSAQLWVLILLAKTGVCTFLAKYAMVINSPYFFISIRISDNSIYKCTVGDSSDSASKMQNGSIYSVNN